ncbi:MAG: hypothetical protein EPN39_21210 [Chitinophagaceae bacterium]|nr:MAG: hypothetical protein EPN39_21210 [Chitinophagaceae bacterium]
MSKSEHWNNFNGDGYRVEVYKILDPEYFKRKFNDNFKVFDFRKKDNPLKNTNYSEYIENGAGFYKSLWNKDEIKTVVIDTVNNKFLYYYCSM